MKLQERKKLDQYYKKYGLTFDQYCELADNGCHLCGRKPKRGQRRLAVDHCHKTGKARGVLCYYCNKYRVGKLTFDWAFKVCEYLQKYE